MQQSQQLRQEVHLSKPEHEEDILSKPENGVEGENEQDAQTSPGVPQTLSPQQEAWLETLGGELERQARSGRNYRHAAVGLLTALLALTVITGFISLNTNSEAMMKFLYLNLLGSVLASVGALVIVVRQSRNRNVSELADLLDRRSVGLLLEAMEVSQDLWEYDNPARKGIKLTLTRLLPQIQAGDASLLNDHQRNCLYRALHFSADWKYPWHVNIEFALAILKALEQIGDEKAIPYVERLAYGEGSALREPRIQQAAQGCLPFLQAYQKQLEAQQTLLRASSSSATAPEELLRATEHTSDVGSEQLLRPDLNLPDEL